MSDAPWIVTLSSFYFFYKNLKISFILNSTVPSLMSFYNPCKAAWSAKVKFASYWFIIDVAKTYRIPFDSLINTTLSIIETYPLAWECVCIADLYWYWYDAIGFGTLSLIQCIYVIKCRVIICLDNRFMNGRPQVPSTFTRTNTDFSGLSVVIYVIQLQKYIFTCRTNPYWCINFD